MSDDERCDDPEHHHRRIGGGSGPDGDEWVIYECVDCLETWDEEEEWGVNRNNEG